MKKTKSTIILIALILGFASSASADLTCNSGTFNDKGANSTCYIGSTAGGDISGEQLSATDVDIVVKDGGRIYTDHVNQSSTNTASISLEQDQYQGRGEFIVRSGGAVHANINISAFNIFVREGGIIDATGLGYQTVPGKSTCPSGTIADPNKDFCLAKGPAGGGGAGTNSGTGTGGGGHAGKGGSFDNSGDDSYFSSGGGRGTVNDQTYGNPKKALTFGSAGGSAGGKPGKAFFLNTKTRDGKKAAYDIDNSKDALGNLYQSNYDGSKFQAAREIIKNASDGYKVNGNLGKRDDPSHDLADSDRWHPNNDQYRVSNPNDITMGAGGGRIRLTAGNKINNSGYILSNGLDGQGIANTDYPGSGGAGGSIFISSGGIFGNGKIWTEGGDYAEYVDGGESNQGTSAVSAGGGGGYVYYEYSIADQNWDLSAEGGQGTVNLGTLDSNGKDFSGNTPKQDAGSRDLIATAGEITSKIAFAAFVNETIVNPGETIKVNGTASSTVTVNITTPNGDQKVLNDTIEPRENDGFYSANISVLDITSKEDLGNYTLTVSSTISGNTITETFQISHRKIGIKARSDYILKPNEQFEVNSDLDLIKEDGSGGINRTNYSNKQFEWQYDDSGNTRVETSTTNTSGGFNFTDSVSTTKGLKYYQTSAENNNGIEGFDRKNLSWMDVNDSVVNPGQKVKLYGTAYSDVGIYFNGSETEGSPITPDTGDGFFEHEFKLPEIESKDKLGNYSISANTPLNGKIRSEIFDVSIRGIAFNLDDNYPKDVEPGKSFKVSGKALKYFEDSSGEYQTSNYSGKELKIDYIGEDELIETKNTQTNINGSFEATGFVSPEKGGDRELRISTINSEGIKGERKESLKTEIKLEASNSTSPVKRIFKDTRLDNTRFVNPSQNVLFEVSTTKSLNFVNNVTARVDIPGEDSKEFNLRTDDSLGEKFKTSEDFQEGTKKKISQRKGTEQGRSELRLGHEQKISDDLLLHLPMETDTGTVEDISGNNLDADIEDPSNIAAEKGIFSTDSLKMDGSQGKGLSIDSGQLNLDKNFTVSAWIKTTSDGTIYSRASAGGSVNLEFRISGDKLEIMVQDSGERVNYGEENVADGDWHHVAGSFNGTHIKLYVDGEKVKEERMKVTPADISGTSKIGSSDIIGGGEEFDGKLDEIAIFDRVISNDRVNEIASSEGSFETNNIGLKNEVLDELKLLSINKSVKGEQIKLIVLSDPDEDGTYEEASDTVKLRKNTNISSVTGLENPSKNFKLNISLNSSNMTVTPTVSEIGLKSRLKDSIDWYAKKPVKDYFNSSYGLYNTTYYAQDLRGNEEESEIEKSNFSVREIKINTPGDKKVSPGNEIDLAGNATLITGDGNGDPVKEAFTGNISILYADMIKGQNIISENYSFKSLDDGNQIEIPVNGTKLPNNTKAQFNGLYTGINDSKIWNQSSDWSNPDQRFGLTVGDISDSTMNGEKVVLGYPLEDNKRELLNYYSFDDKGTPVKDSSDGQKDMKPVNSPVLSSKGLFNRNSIKMESQEGLIGNLSFERPEDFSINLWVKPENLNEEQQLLTLGEKLNLSLTSTGNVKAVVKTTGTNTTSTTEGNLKNDSWKMVTLTYQGSNQLMSVSTGVGGDRESVGDIENAKNIDFSGDKIQIGSNGYNGKVDEMRIYNQTVNQIHMRDIAGDQALLTSVSLTSERRDFQRTVKPGSLLFEVHADTNGQSINVSLMDQEGATSDPVEIRDDSTIYEIPGTEGLKDSSKYRIKVNPRTDDLTKSPELYSVELKQRKTTKDPSLNLSSSEFYDAGYSGRIVGGNTQTVKLENLTNGMNEGQVDIVKGLTGLNLVFEEVLASPAETQPEIQLDSEGSFNTSFQVPSTSGESIIKYFTTNNNGIGALSTSKATSSLRFESANVSNPESGKKLMDINPADDYQINATLQDTGGSINRVWANITGPNNGLTTVELTYTGSNWQITESISNINDGEGLYEAEILAESDSGIRELEPAKVSFNVTDGRVTANKSKNVVGLGRNFNVSGKVQQTYTGESVDGEVNITVPSVGQKTANVEGGQYKVEVEAPSTTGTHTVNISAEDADTIQSNTTTDIEVNDTTDISTTPLENINDVEGVTLEEGVINEVPVNISNDGDTDARNIKVYAEDLPTIEHVDPQILEEEGGRNWTTVNETYNVSSGETKTVNAKVNVSQASQSGDYGLNISTSFETTGGVMKNTTNDVVLKVRENVIPSFKQNITVSRREGFHGNFIPPDGITNLSLKNDGTSAAENAGWKVQKPRFSEKWIENFVLKDESSEDNGSFTLFSNNQLNFLRLEGSIPKGTPPGNYSTKLVPFSDNPQEKVNSTFKVKVEDTPEWKPKITALKEGVTIPETVNKSNPIDIGSIALENQEDVLNLTFNNTGNRNLTLETKSGGPTASENLFYQNYSNNPDIGEETFKSEITKSGNYEYNIENPSAIVGYTTSGRVSETGPYSENLTITCNAASSENECSSKTLKIPLEGTIENPAPEFSNTQVTPQVAGKGQQIDITGEVDDNTNVQEVKITVIKHLETEQKVAKSDGSGVNFDPGTNEFSATFDATKDGKYEGNDHNFEVVLDASDDEGKTRTLNKGNVTVRDKANLEIHLNKTSLSFDNVTANSRDTLELKGKVNDTEIPVTDIQLTGDIDEAFSGGEVDDVNLTNEPLSVGSLDPRNNNTFTVNFESKAGISSSYDYDGFLQPSWDNPDGNLSSGSIANFEVSAEANRIITVEGDKSLTVDHNSTLESNLTVTSAGNTRLDDINLECIGCTNDIYVSGYGAQGFSLQSGESAVIPYNVSVDKFTDSKTRDIDIKVSSDSKTKYINDTSIFVPEQRAVKIEPTFQERVLPIDSGTINVTTITAKNTGNTALDPLTLENPTDIEFYLGESDVNPYTETLNPGDQTQIRAKSNTAGLSPSNRTETIDPSDSTSLDQYNTAVVNLTLQDIGFDLLDQSKNSSIKSGDQINAEFNLTNEDQPIEDGNGVEIQLVTEDQVFDVKETYDSGNGTWKMNFEAPALEDGVDHTFEYQATSDAFESIITSNKDVSYLDVTPPKFINLTGAPVEKGEGSNIGVTLKDNSDIPDNLVTATIKKPSGETDKLELQNQSGQELSKTDFKEWKTTYTNTTEEGRYNLTVTSTDSKGNTGESDFELFRVFRPLSVKGDAGDPSNQTEIRLVDAAGDVAEKVNPINQTYDQTIKSGTYEEAQIQVDDDKVAKVDNLSASKINQSPPKINADIKEDFVNVEEKYLKGYALESETFENVNGSTGFSYTDVVDRVDFQGNLQVLKCEEYNISSANPCKTQYNPIDQDKIGIDTDSQTVAVDEIDGFSSYILVENTTSSTESNLNIDLTGELGNLDNLGDLSGLQNSLQDVADNTQDLNNIDNIDSGNSGGGGGFSDVGSGTDSNALDNIASQLNESENQDLAVGNSEVYVEIQPGATQSTAISIQNPKEESLDISLEATENIRDMLDYQTNFSLDAGEFRTVKIDVDAKNLSELREYSGFIQIKGGSSDRSVPFSIAVVSSEQRLLDVTLDPTVDSFKPGGTARLEISFSNQGFSRNVDAETEIEIVNIGKDEVIANKTVTYAVQTTLDKVVELKIPESADLGTYEARANVKYSNIPDNRSALAVSQVEIQRPFWERNTLGVPNSYYLIMLILLIIAGSGGGYWYYRKKKLEEKRRRFEEQVDNEEIPDETGRTAFVGELSEIGTRSFIELEDLKTHCLTAGATGAGKSVAAQVIVEEALEKGVNVIVLDPTGQWSGYLQENEDKQMETFYEDFGMSQSDERDYRGNIRAVDADQDAVDITDVLRPEEDEGSIHVFSMHKLDNAELEEYLSDTIKQIFEYNPEEKDELQTLVVYDEAHRVLEKFGGTGEGVKQLERGAREFRKWGIGMVMISQVIGDFPSEVRANIGTQIQMRTEYEGDLDRIERKYGNHISQGVTKANTGTGMLQNSSYNHGRPYFVDFRPLKHSPERISDEKLDKFEEYNRRVDEIDDMITVLEDMGEDVFDYSSRLDLARKNIRKMSFNLADTYLDELEEELDEELDM